MPIVRLLLLVLVAIRLNGAEPAKPPTLAEVLAKAQPTDWRRLDPENTLYLDFAGGRVVIELAPDFAPRHVQNVKELVREKYFDGLAFLRAQDNYVVQWGDPNSEKPAEARPIQRAQRTLAPEFERTIDERIKVTLLPDGDVYAPEAGFAGGFPIARDPKNARMWLVHCYGMVGAGRDTAADSGGGTELYVIIGHGPRHLDRNVTLLGRVVQGMELLSVFPRGPGAMGFYEKPEQRTLIKSIRVAADMPAEERTELEIMRTDTPLFSELIEARRNRREEWFHAQAGRIEICNVPIPVRPAKAAPQVVEIWPGMPPDEQPGAIGPEKVRMSPQLSRTQVEVTNSTRLITAVTRPTISIYRPPAKLDTGAAVLIFPGGGYWDLYWELEGEEVAAWLNTIGVTGIVLKYRVPRRPDEPQGQPARRPLQDAQRALSVIRARAEEWQLRKLGVMGFSAGGHLAIASGTEFDTRKYPAVDDIDKINCRPDFAVAVYSGYLKPKEEERLEKAIRVPEGTPPMFLIHGHDDPISAPEGTVLMYLALKRAGIPAELHIYANTTHDFGVRPSERPFGRWTEACAAWLRDQGFLAMNRAK